MKKFKKKFKKGLKFIVLAFSFFKILVELKEIFMLFKDFFSLLTNHQGSICFSGELT